MRRLYFNQKGIGLVEVIAALGISVVVITSLLSLTLFSLRTSLQSTVMMEATKAANQQMELLRAYRDTVDWNTFLGVTNCTGNCHLSSNLIFNTSAPAIVYSGGTTITVGITATSDASDVVHAKVTASWNIGGQNKSTYVYTDFTNWQGK
ncbi:MAG: hypothetical protein KatS3mg101_0416 [Patescibacteria group bacterium]|nr:MAG: hypothetical protein KatS3mg101_0416 [Patescibacteria group bacterium]